MRDDAIGSFERLADQALGSMFARWLEIDAPPADVASSRRCNGLPPWTTGGTSPSMALSLTATGMPARNFSGSSATSTTLHGTESPAAHQVGQFAYAAGQR